MSVRINGGKELDAFLAKFPADLQRKVLRNALRRGANVIRDDARQRIPRKSGVTAKAIKSGTRVDNGIPKGRVRMRGRKSFLGYLLEFGVAAHYLGGGDSGLSARKLTQRVRAAGAMKIGENFVTGAILHPGFAPKPFMRPALEAKAAEAVQAVGNYISTWLQVGTLKAPPIEAEDE